MGEKTGRRVYQRVRDWVKIFHFSKNSPLNFILKQIFNTSIEYTNMISHNREEDTGSIFEENQDR
jgi:hypothetical protein